jgi:hypothetical protein
VDFDFGFWLGMLLLVLLDVLDGPDGSIGCLIKLLWDKA